jgi:NADH dehydrogenase/NADH:ubiquinone oxidoreductase subunit G
MTRADAQGAPTGGLALLVETEDRLEAMLAERREEAARLVAVAERESADRLGRLEAALMEEEERIRAAAEERASEETAADAREGERRARRYREVPDARVDALAAWVADRVIDPSGDVP